VCRYEFSTETIEPTARFADAFAPQAVPRFGYRTYDCVPASPGRRFSDLDLYVVNGLNARTGMAELARLRSFADRAAGHLDVAYRMQPDFLRLTWVELGDNPTGASAGWHLNQAWRQGVATPELGVARVHKLLHHKRPHLFPLLDGETIEPIAAAATSAGCNIWQLIHQEIDDHAEQFDSLAGAFDRRATGPGDVSLSRLPADIGNSGWAEIRIRAGGHYGSGSPDIR
jgi:hypothetical protein